jgi:hypothetical protein
MLSSWHALHIQTGKRRDPNKNTRKSKNEGGIYNDQSYTSYTGQHTYTKPGNKIPREKKEKKKSQER